MAGLLRPKCRVTIESSLRLVLLQFDADEGSA